MKRVVLLAMLAATVAEAQGDSAGKVIRTPKPYTPLPIFMNDAPLEITLTAPFRQLKRSRTGVAPYRWATITYRGDSGAVRVPLRVRPRGIWRRKNCEIPPLRLNFAKDSSKKTEFRHVDGARLVPHCRDIDDYEQYVLQEFNLYRVQRLLTPLSFDVRLVHVTYVDSERRDTLARRYSFILEDEKTFERRQGGNLVEVKGADATDLDRPESALFGLWQYFIGNTDFSVAGLHNVALLQRDTAYYPVAYDFDFSGAVNTRYAAPPQQLRIRRVTERLMRGYCVPPRDFEAAFEKFRQEKDAIYGLYHDALSAHLKPHVVESTLHYFDEFYEVINDPKLAKKLILDACIAGLA